MTEDQRTELADLGRKLAEAAAGLATQGRQLEDAARRVAECALEGGYQANDLFSIPAWARQLEDAAAALPDAAQAIVAHFDKVREAADDARAAHARKA